MIVPNLPKLDSEKVIYSVRLYKQTINTLESLSEKTGIRTQDLIRTAINDFVDSDQVKALI